MKCPNCGQWNQSAFPRCYRCGVDLPQAEKDPLPLEPSWQDRLHDVEPAEIYIHFEDHADARILPSKEAQQDILGREIESLKERRERGAFQLAGLRQQARRAKESIANAAIIKPAEDPDPYEALLSARTVEDLDGDARVPHRHRNRANADGSVPSAKRPRRSRAGQDPQTVVLQPIEMPSVDEATRDWRGQTAAAWKTVNEFIYTDDESAPVLYDGYTPSPADKHLGARGMDPDPMIAEREKAAWSASRHSAISTTFANGKHQTLVPKSVPQRKPRRRRHQNVMLVQWAAILAGASLVIAGVILGMPRLLSLLTPAQSQAENTTPAEISKSELDGNPAHTIWISGKENTTIYIEELKKAYVVTGGSAEIQIADYIWYETLEEIPDGPMPVTLTPVVRYAAGEQQQMAPIHYTIDIPDSPVRLIRPETKVLDVTTSIFDLRFQVERGSRVVIDHDDVTDLIDANGRVTKSVHVPVGENRVQVMVRSPRCRPNSFEITLRRAPQDVPLEMAADTLSETEGTSDEDFLEKEARDAALAALNEQRKKPVKKPQMKLYARTVPGAEIEILSPYVEGSLDTSNLEKADSDGSFSFIATFPDIGDNTVIIRATLDGRESILPHVVYYVPPVDVYSRKAWPLDRGDYLDLVNNIDARKGQVYVCKGIIKEIRSESPQLAIMDTDPSDSEQLVMLENNSKTRWEEGRYYRVYGEAFVLYNAMPRINVRYTFTD